MASEIDSLHSRVRVLHRWREPGDPELVAAQAELDELARAERIRRLVDAAPPLSEETRAKLAALFGGGDSAPSP